MCNKISQNIAHMWQEVKDLQQKQLRESVCLLEHISYSLNILDDLPLQRPTNTNLMS